MILKDILNEIKNMDNVEMENPDSKLGHLFFLVSKRKNQLLKRLIKARRRFYKENQEKIELFYDCNKAKEMSDKEKQGMVFSFKNYIYKLILKIELTLIAQKERVGSPDFIKSGYDSLFLKQVVEEVKQERINDILLFKMSKNNRIIDRLKDDDKDLKKAFCYFKNLVEKMAKFEYIPDFENLFHFVLVYESYQRGYLDDLQKTDLFYILKENI